MVDYILGLITGALLFWWKGNHDRKMKKIYFDMLQDETKRLMYFKRDSNFWFKSYKELLKEKTDDND